MARNPYLSVEIASLRNEISTWRNVKLKLADQLADIVLLRSFFQMWDRGIDSGKSVDNAYRDALDALPQDDPKTPWNEGLTEREIKDLSEKLFDTTWDDVVRHVNEANNAFEQNLELIRKNIYEIIVKQRTVSDHVEELDNQMSDLTNVQNSYQT